MKFLVVISQLLFCCTGYGTVQWKNRSEDGPYLEQALPSITTGGKNPTLVCILRGGVVTHHVLSWYLQIKAKEIQFLVSHRENSSPTYGAGVTERFIPEVEPLSNAFTLTIGNVENSDEGTYYCAIWFSYKYIFGEGTVVRVQVFKDTQRPQMTILGPSLMEIQLHRSAAFLCHAAKFSPNALRIKWQLNNQSSQYRPYTYPALQTSIGTFDQTSEMTIPAALWDQGAEVTCILEHETGVQRLSTRAIKKQRACKPERFSNDGMKNATTETEGNLASFGGMPPLS
ncbi:immunoglobulin alpha-2 heavy chain-like isoform X2 [Xenopus laevis]|uniref:immunoglobulin alpha-2 heavy chain-like isoform X2 n=1 Tax=Xenopus laevis TaxID=8355 RepID=UPI001BB1C337|nr:immunoglobulin alpha-2 heavy chain-like isoform X2 [Xenopus laevis]